MSVYEPNVETAPFVTYEFAIEEDTFTTTIDFIPRYLTRMDDGTYVVHENKPLLHNGCFISISLSSCSVVDNHSARCVYNRPRCWKIEDFAVTTRKPIEVKKYDPRDEDIRLKDIEIEQLKNENARLRDLYNESVWLWHRDEENDVATLTCDILISPEDFAHELKQKGIQHNE